MDELLDILARTAESPAGSDPARYRGTLLGLAVGNALGGPLEGLTRPAIRRIYPEGLREIKPEETHDVWDDDVAQAIELAESLLPGPLDQEDLLYRFVRWAAESGRGMGSQTRGVLTRAASGARRTWAAREVWERSDRTAAGNGAVMRCAPVTLRWRRHPLRLVTDARRSARVTHFDPRSVWTTVATCTAVAHALAQRRPSLDRLAAALRVAGAPEGVVEAIGRAGDPDLEALSLDDRGSMGYTVKTMTVALWAALHGSEFEADLLRIVHAGGDSDTNGAVAGAVLGARLGSGAIPERWTSRLPDRDQLAALAERLRAAAENGDGARLRRNGMPILYLDIDGVLLRDVPPSGSGPEARAEPRTAADGAADFLRWARDRFEVRWLTAWAPEGRLDPTDRRRLAEVLECDAEVLGDIEGLPWPGRKIDGIDVDDPRPWLWIDDAPHPDDLETLRHLGADGRWIECRSDLSADALSQVRARLTERLSFRSEPPAG